MTVDGVVLELSEEVKKAMQEANEKRQQSQGFSANNLHVFPKRAS